MVETLCVAAQSYKVEPRRWRTRGSKFCLSSPEAVCDIGDCGLTWCQTDRGWRGLAIRGEHDDFTLFKAELHVRLNAKRPKDVGDAFAFVVDELAYGKGGAPAGPGVFVFSLGAPAERASAPRAEVAGPSR